MMFFLFFFCAFLRKSRKKRSIIDGTTSYLCGIGTAFESGKDEGYGEKSDVCGGGNYRLCGLSCGSIDGSVCRRGEWGLSSALPHVPSHPELACSLPQRPLFCFAGLFLRRFFSRLAFCFSFALLQILWIRIYGGTVVGWAWRTGLFALGSLSVSLGRCGMPFVGLHGAGGFAPICCPLSKPKGGCPSLSFGALFLSFARPCLGAMFRLCASVGSVFVSADFVRNIGNIVKIGKFRTNCPSLLTFPAEFVIICGRNGGFLL